MQQYLFVHGTLKRRSRHPMARRLALSARWVGAARMAGRLYHLGRFPGLKPPGAAADWVEGDVYDLGEHAERTLMEMDAYENSESPPPAPYERELATARFADGSVAPVWVYWYRGDVCEEQFLASGSFEENCEPA
jgi:gamma-glutamylcyclotransferase (GGCT)/AIG2-like uncharacterized protein YtfP